MPLFITFNAQYSINQLSAVKCHSEQRAIATSAKNGLRTAYLICLSAKNRNNRLKLFNFDCKYFSFIL